MIEMNIALSDMLLINEAMKKADDNEIGGFGTIMYTESGVPYVEHLYIPKQDISGTEVDWGMDGVLDYINYLNEKGDNRASRGLFSWHSHNTMDVYWSTTDEKFIRLAGSEGVPYIFSVVLNNKGERKDRLDVFAQPKCELITGPLHTFYDDSETNLVVFESEKITERREEVDKIRQEMDAETAELKAKRDEEIKAIEETYQSDIEAARKHVENMTNSLRGDAKKHIEDIWEERITEKYDYHWGYGMGYGKALTIGNPRAWADDDGWQDDYLRAAGMEDIINIAEEIGDDIMFYEFDDRKFCFRDTIVIGDSNYGREISITEAKANFVDVWDLVAGEISNVSVFDYLLSNYDMDDEEGEFELVTSSNSGFDREFQAANAASLK